MFGTVDGGDRGHVGDVAVVMSWSGCGGAKIAISGAKVLSKSTNRLVKGR